jgi:hypothetical protein
MKNNVKIEIVFGVEDNALYINDRRVAGPKPWGGGQTVCAFYPKLSLVRDSLPTCKENLQVQNCLNDLLRWCDALAIVGSVTPEAWMELDKLTHNARAALGGKKDER